MSGVPPSGKCIADVSKVTTTVNTDDYARTELNIIIKRDHLEEEYAGVHAPLDEQSRLKRVRAHNLEVVARKAPLGLATWQELENIKPGTINFVDASVYEQIDKVKIKSVILPFYIDPDTSQLARNYIIDDETGETLSKEKETVVDNILYGWLIAHDMACDDSGIVHYRTKEGVMTDVVPAKVLRDLMEDVDEGIETKAKRMIPDVEFVLFWTPPELQEYAAQQVEASNAGQKQSR